MGLIMMDSWEADFSLLRVMGGGTWEGRVEEGTG